MGVQWIRSEIQCDDCGSRFQVEHDAAYRPPAGWALWDVSEDAVRGGYVHGLSIFDGSCSVQDGRMLCIPCTRAADATSSDTEGGA